MTLQESAQFPLSIPVNTAGADFLSTGIAARAWRFEGRVAVAGAVRLGVDAWEDGHPQRPDRALDGDACLWFQHAGPFVAALREGYAEADARVEENLEALNALLLLLIQEIQPDRLAVYTDAGFHHPLNAHAVYHRRRAGFMEDLALIRRLWREGAPGWRLAPLADPSTPKDGDTLHGWRSLEQRARLWAAVGEILGQDEREGRVGEVLTSGVFDFYERGEGVLLLEYPHMLNAFIDRFYIELGRS